MRAHDREQNDSLRHRSPPIARKDQTEPQILLPDELFNPEEAAGSPQGGAEFHRLFHRPVQAVQVAEAEEEEQPTLAARAKFKFAAKHFFFDWRYCCRVQRRSQKIMRRILSLS